MKCFLDFNRNDRKVKESQMLLEEEKSSAQRLQDQVNQLNTKIRNLRREKEDAESEVETEKKKLRQIRSQLDEAEDTNTTLQAQMNKLRAASRKAKVELVPSLMLSKQCTCGTLCIYYFNAIR